MAGSHKIKQFYLNQIKDVLSQKNISLTDGNDDKEKNIPAESISPVCSTRKRKIEVVVFKDKNSKLKTNSQKMKNAPISKDTEDEKLLKAKSLLKEIEWDVTSFGLKGFSLEEKRKMEQDRAIRLGAKPRKQKCVNYKVFMEERKKQKESGDKPTGKRKKKRTVFWKESQSMPTGTKGRFKDGVLELSKEDLEFR